MLFDFPLAFTEKRIRAATAGLLAKAGRMGERLRGMA
ncbi:hypothetical protein QU631_24250, partial [Enterobacter hormaechei subsp. xiangfangensis]